MTAILFVCMGNICRSPAAEGVFRQLVADAGLEPSFEIESAGTIGYHAGQQADRRMRSVARNRGYILDGTARCIQPEDFQRFDLIVTMDEDNFSKVSAMDTGAGAKVVRMCDYCTKHDIGEVPDPYYGGKEGFHAVIDILEDACNNLLKKLT